MTEEIVVRLRSSVFSWRIAGVCLLIAHAHGWLLIVTVNLGSEDLWLRTED